MVSPIMNPSRPASRPRRDATHPAVTEGNKLHIFWIAADGTVSQAGAPLNLPVPASARSIGLVVS